MAWFGGKKASERNAPSEDRAAWLQQPGVHRAALRFSPGEREEKQEVAREQKAVPQQARSETTERTSGLAERIASDVRGWHPARPALNAERVMQDLQAWGKAERQTRVEQTRVMRDDRQLELGY